MDRHRKLRQPVVSEDEMVEVRELFKRVDCVRQSGFTGNGTWKSSIPSASTLSKNRLQRRRALCSVELSHLNYQEAPFEWLNHLQNIRGMCARIQRQDYPIERKKKAVDLKSRPPISRRPVSSTTVKNLGKKQRPSELRRSSTTSNPKKINDHKDQKSGVKYPFPQYYSSRCTAFNNDAYELHSTSSIATGFRAYCGWSCSDEVTPPSDSDYSTSTRRDSKSRGYTAPGVKGSGRGNPSSCMQSITPNQVTKAPTAATHRSKYDCHPWGL